MRPAFLDWTVPEAVTDLYDWQDGRCAMCGTTDRYGGLVMDHDHRTHLICGLLCRSCNGSEPHSTRDEWEAWRAGDHAAAKLGVVEEYAYTFPGQRVMYDMANRELTDAEIDAVALAASESSDETEAVIAEMNRAAREQRLLEWERRAVEAEANG